MSLTTISEVARQHGSDPSFLSSLFYRGILDERRLIPLGNRRLIPTDFLDEVGQVLTARERLRPKSKRELATA